MSLSEKTKEDLKKFRAVVIQVLSSFILIMIFIFHIGSAIALDAIDIFLIIIFVIIWFWERIPQIIPHVKSVGIAGLNVEFRDVDAAVQHIKNAGLAPEPSGVEQERTWINIITYDSNLGIAGLRIIIEEILRTIGIRSQIIKRAEKISIYSLLDKLLKKNEVTQQEYDALKNLLLVLDPAAHGAKVSDATVELITNNGPSITTGLSRKLSTST